MLEPDCVRAFLRLFVIVAALLAPSASHAANRLALVIGNSAYTHTGPLKNPRNDAELIAKTLELVGFRVTRVLDASRDQMRRALLDFGRKLRANKDGVGLFYYAGHGLQVRGLNYMVPVNANIKDEEEVAFEGVDMNEFLATMRSSKSRLNIIILDACRNNPFSRSFRSVSRGLAPVQAASGSLIAYSTAPGDVAFDGNGVNSPYTLALSRFMRKPGLAVETVFKRVLAQVEDTTGKKQTPWTTGAFRGEFYFVSRSQKDKSDQGVQEAMSGMSASNAENNGQALEKLFWQSIVNSTNPESFKAYLTSFPSGLFAPLAKLKVEQYGKGSSQRSTTGTSNSAMAAPPGTTPKSEQPVLDYRYLFADSSRREFKDKDVKNLDCHKLWLARSEILFRNNRCFRDEKSIRYFGNANCSTTRISLKPAEYRNMRTIRTWEIRKRCRIKQAARRRAQPVSSALSDRSPGSSPASRRKRPANSRRNNRGVKRLERKLPRFHHARP